MSDLVATVPPRLTLVAKPPWRVLSMLTQWTILPKHRNRVKSIHPLAVLCRLSTNTAPLRVEWQAIMVLQILPNVASVAPLHVNPLRPHVDIVVPNPVPCPLNENTGVTTPVVVQRSGDRTNAPNLLPLNFVVRPTIK